MTTDENILIEMLERVTNPSRDSADNLAVQMFCMIVQSNIDLVTKAHELIVKKMHSNNTAEAARAIGLLEECMSKAGLEFQKKTAKFTFLNELIALVLDKHDGPPAPIDTKKRIMDCLMLWTVEHQDKTKIQEAYDNLKRQVNFDHNSSTANSTNTALSKPPRMERSSILGKDEQLVAKLLKQGGAENYKKANLLILHRVNQETRRTEFICHLKSELKKIENTMEVFEQMLNAYSLDSADEDNRDIILELYNTCNKQNEQMARWPDFLGEGEPKLLEDVLNTRDLLMISLQRYKKIFQNEQCSSPANTTTSSTNTDLLSDLLGDPVATSTQATIPSKPKSPAKQTDSNTLNELNEIFGSIVDNTAADKPHHPTNLMTNLDLLEPINVFETKATDMAATTVPILPVINGKEEKKVSGFKELKEIDKLSEEMFKQNLKKEQRLQSFKRDNEKLTLNDMAKDKKEAALSATKDTEKPVQIALAANQRNTLNTFEDLTVNLEDLKETNRDCTEKTRIEEKQEKTEKSCLTGNTNSESCKTFKPLAEIFVDLDEVTPLDEGQRLLLDDDDIQVTLYFTADRPSEHVSVMVMSVINKSKLPVRDFQFEASVKKPCKVRLLPPTDVAMAPRNPFRPLTPINQVVLLLNPTQNPVDISCIIGYKLGDDPDPIKELIVTKDIPYV